MPSTSAFQYPLAPGVPVLLASGSPRRAEILGRYFPKLKIQASDFAEDLDPATFPSPAAYARENARQKLNVVIQGRQQEERGRNDGELIESAEYMIIASDTIVVQSNVVLEKPKSFEHNIEMVQGLLKAGQHSVISAVAVYEPVTKRIHEFHEETQVFMNKSVHPAIVESYVRTGEGRDKAGGYGYQGLGAFLIERIQGCYYNVVGFPLPAFISRLQEWLPPPRIEEGDKRSTRDEREKPSASSQC